MHSSAILKGDDFSISIAGKDVSWARFFDSFTIHRRLGFVAPKQLDAAGAATLIMAHVTAFYDQYRATGEAYFVYPDYFGFVSADKPVPDYSMLDIWPSHKVVPVDDSPLNRLRAITDRAVNVLLVPDGSPGQNELDDVAIGSAMRCIDTCYSYSFDGQPRNADLTVSCPSSPISDWVERMFDSLGQAGTASDIEEWRSQFASDGRLTQSFRKIDLDEALTLL